MTSASGMVPTRAHRGRFLVLGVLRPLLTVVLLVTAYYLVPSVGRMRGATLVLLVAGLAVVTAVVAWEVRSILRSRYPLLQGVQALSLSVPLFLLVFAEAYLVLDQVRSGSFSAPLTKTDALYFTVTVFATVGFGDIVPVAQHARILVTVQMIGDLLVLGLGLRVILTAVRRGRAGRAEAESPGDDMDRDLRPRHDR